MSPQLELSPVPSVQQREGYQCPPPSPQAVGGRWGSGEEENIMVAIMVGIVTKRMSFEPLRSAKGGRYEVFISALPSVNGAQKKNV